MKGRTAGRGRLVAVSRRLPAAVGVAGALVPALAEADTSLPVIVTYEFARQRDDARVAATDPKGFWIGQIMRRIEDSKRTTPVALTRASTVQVAFTVSRDGHVTSKRVTTSSGLPPIDAAALAVVERAAPFPPMPAALGDKEQSFVLPLRFR